MCKREELSQEFQGLNLHTQQKVFKGCFFLLYWKGNSLSFKIKNPYEKWQKWFFEYFDILNDFLLLDNNVIFIFLICVIWGLGQ